MRKALLVLIAFVLPAAASAQWQFDSEFPPDEDRQFSSAHGIAVDPDGKVWVQYFGPTDSVQVPALDDTFQPVRVIYVFNPDGTEADISPIKFLDFPGGERDTLGGHVFVNDSGEKQWFSRPGVGLRADHNGNIIVSVDASPGTVEESGILYRVNFQTGEGMNKATFDARGPTAAAVDDDGNVYITDVFPGDPILVFDENFNFIGNAIDATVGFSRAFEVSADGNTIFWAGYTNNAVIAYQRPDEFSPYDSLGVVIPGVASESMVRHPTTGNLWVSAGSPNDPPNNLEGFDTNWQVQTWYAFDPDNLTVDSVPTPLDSLTWQVGDGASEHADGRPRGIDFAPDGDAAYVIQFSQTAPSVQKFVPGEDTAIDVIDTEVPQTIVLDQNYPNPFNPTTRIRFSVKETAPVSLKVYDVLGREVAVLVDRTVAPGTFDVTLNARGLPSGNYVYVLEANGERLSKTMMLVK